MTSVIFLAVFAALTHTFAGLLIKGEDRRWVSKVMLIAWFSLFPLLTLINHWFPFAGGGDDESYFYLATTQFHSLADLFDPTKFIDLVEQPGYPVLLSILYQFTGQDLLAFKLLNLAFFVMLIPLWYRIGMELDSGAFGRAVAVAIFLLTPLWYYGFFVLKDMTIILLQSVFLLSVVQISRGGGKGGWLLCVAATLALIPFRSQLVLVNAGVLAGAVALISIRRAEPGKAFTTVIVPLTMLAIMLATVLTVASNFELMAAIGIYSEQRVVGSAAARESVAEYAFSSEMNRGLFPLLYLFSETAGLNPQTWADFDAVTGVRSVLVLPWIFVGVPFFVFGLLQLMRADSRTMHSGGVIAAVQSMRLVATPWGGVLMFILIYMVVSWTVGDTTRWRIPDMPAMAAVAVYGWMNFDRRARLPILLLWILASGSLFMLYYLIRE
jgi:hypothetical protein